MLWLSQKVCSIAYFWSVTLNSARLKASTASFFRYQTSSPTWIVTTCFLSSLQSKTLISIIHSFTCTALRWQKMATQLSAIVQIRSSSASSEYHGGHKVQEAWLQLTGLLILTIELPRPASRRIEPAMAFLCSVSPVRLAYIWSIHSLSTVRGDLTFIESTGKSWTTNWIINRYSTRYTSLLKWGGCVQVPRPQRRYDGVNKVIWNG